MDYHHYVAGIAEARHAIRKVFRIVDECAKEAGLDPLEHQALIQVYGSAAQCLQVNDVARRLDIAAAFASRLLRSLETKGYVDRRASLVDRRATEVHMTEAGRDVIHAIDANVRVHVDYFQKQLPIDSKITALSIMAFYIGLDVTTEAVEALVSAGQQAAT